MKKRLLLAIWLLAGTVGFAYWWDSALIAIPLSETVWTIYFHLTGQTNTGLAADLEFMTVLAFGFSLSYAAWRARGFLMQPRNALLVLWLIVGTYLSIVWWVNSPVTFQFRLVAINFYNGLLKEFYASILEIVTVAAAGFLLCYGVAQLFLFLVKRTKRAE